MAIYTYQPCYNLPVQKYFLLCITAFALTGCTAMPTLNVKVPFLESTENIQVELKLPESSPTASPTKLQNHQKTRLQVGQKELTVEVVNTLASRAKGLSDRSEIGADGMWFIFDDRQTLVFWMKDMRFDLDLVWIDQGKIIEITPNVPHPAPSANENDLPTYQPKSLADMVLEIPAGKAAEWQLKVGDEVRLVE